jgi:hypothetical protein
MPLPNQTIDPTALGSALLNLVNGQSGGSTAIKAVSGSPNAQYMHGYGGLFSTPGVRAPVFSAMGLPVSGLLARLPAIPNDEDYPLFAILTGQTDNTGTQPLGNCPDYPVVGKLKACRQNMVFGRRGIATEVFDITRVGRRNDRSEMLDFQLIGNALAGGQQGAKTGIPGIFGNGGGDILNNEIMAQMYKMAVGFVYETSADLWTANHDTSAIDMYGLQKLVNTGYRDVLQGVPCTAADSLVRPFGSATIGQGVNGAVLVAELVYQYRYVRNIANHTRVKATWAFVMRESLFYEVTAVWPCSYYTNRCTTNGNTNFTDAEALTRMRDEMRGDIDNYTGQFLWVDGQKVEVIIDDTVPETMSAGGKFVSDIYLLPMTVNNLPVTFIEYFNYDGPNGPIKAAQALGGGAQNFVMSVDGGRFLIIYKTPTNTCFQYQMQSEMRLILRTPFLAARTTNVGYVPLIANRNYDPNSASFYDGGGIQNNNGFNPPYYYSPVA